MGYFEELGDECKCWESVATDAVLPREQPFIARLDGRSFSKLTKTLDKPYDLRMARSMLGTTQGLLKVLHADLAYTQSDEITLVWFRHTLNPETQVLFGGRIQKLTSVIAAQGSVYFFAIYSREFPESREIPHFDCRVWAVPNIEEAAKVLLWRQLDARRNSVSMLAQRFFSAKALHGINNGEKLEMLKERGQDWTEWPTHFKEGLSYKNHKVHRFLTMEEALRIPEEHRPRYGTLVERHEIQPHEFAYEKAGHRSIALSREENDQLVPDNPTTTDA